MRRRLRPDGHVDGHVDVDGTIRERSDDALPSLR